MADIPHVTNDRIRSLDLPPGEVRGAVRDAFAARATGDAELLAKVALHPRRGGQFYSMPASVRGLAGVKWLNIAAEPSPDRPYIQAQMLCTDVRSGRTLALLDAEWITGIRTAAVSALAVERLSAPDADAFAVIGCGLQARTHLDALLEVRPVRRVVCQSRRRATAERFAAEVRERGLEADVVEDANDALARTPVTIVASPITIPDPGFLDARRASPASVTVALEYAVAFARESLGAFDRIYTDDLEHTRALVTAGLVPELPRWDGDLASSAGAMASTGEAPVTGRGLEPAALAPKSARVLFVPPGVALADVAVARLVLQRLRLWSGDGA